MRVQLGESFYGLGGFMHFLEHELNFISKEIKRDEPSKEAISDTVDSIREQIMPVKIMNKYIPYALLDDYIHAIREVERTASYKNKDIIKNADYNRQYRHLTILEFAQEERNGEWDKKMHEWIEDKMEEEE